MSSFNDIRCPKCGKRMGWVGEIPDIVVCIRCEHTIDLREDKKLLSAARAELLKEIDRDDGQRKKEKK